MSSESGDSSDSGSEAEEQSRPEATGQDSDSAANVVSVPCNADSDNVDSGDEESESDESNNVIHIETNQSEEKTVEINEIPGATSPEREENEEEKSSNVVSVHNDFPDKADESSDATDDEDDVEWVENTRPEVSVKPQPDESDSNASETVDSRPAEESAEFEEEESNSNAASDADRKITERSVDMEDASNSSFTEQKPAVLDESADSLHSANDATRAPQKEVSDGDSEDSEDIAVSKPYNSSGHRLKDDFDSGNDSEPSSSQKLPPVAKLSQQDLFGASASEDGSSSDEDERRETSKNKESEPTHGDERVPIEEDEDEEPAETCINVDFPLIRANLGRQIHFVKMPNFLSVDTRPFDSQTYEDELDEDEMLDEEGRARLKLKVENTIRWRYAKDEEGIELKDEYGHPIRESNAKMIRWSDGTYSLHLGNEIFDVHIMDTAQEHNHLFIRQGSGLQGQAVFKTKLTFRPHSIASNTHRKITMSLADKSTKQQMVKVLPLFGQNPERVREEALRQEEDRVKARVRRENIQRRKHEISASKTLSSSFLEGDEGDEDEGVSLAAIKKNARMRKSVGAVYSEDSSSLSSEDPEPRRTSKKSAIHLSDDDQDEDIVSKKKRKRVVSDEEEAGDEHAEDAGTQPNTSSAMNLSSSSSESSLD